ncbi:MAG: IS110 family transposase [Actinomycetia bacterium]|nr:IS110 family transposase [Actinomycetes bacterium]
MAAIDIGKRVLQAAALDRESGVTADARFAGDREALAGWVDGFEGRLGVVAIEATTGWKWIAAELEAREVEVVLVDPGEAAAKKGKKRRAKTDRLDARFLLGLLVAGMLPEAWRPPVEIQELRTLTRTRKALVDQRTETAERVHALLFHEGWPCAPGRLLSRQGRRWIDGLRLAEPIRLALDALLGLIDDLDRRLEPLAAELAARAKTDPRLRGLQQIFGVGPVVASHLLAEIGDGHRFQRARQVVRLAGLDPTVHESGETKRRGRLSKAGPPLLRWALVEAAQNARRTTSPDHERWQRINARRGPQVANLTIARTIAGRAHRALRELDEAA